MVDRWVIRVGPVFATLSLLAVGALIDPHAGTTWISTALADTSTAAAESATADAADVPLPELPKLAPLQHPAPKAEAVKDLEARLSQLGVSKPDGPIDDDFDLGFLTADLAPTATALSLIHI